MNQSESSSEEHRHRCEIRDLCRKTTDRGMGWLKSYVVDWKRWESIREDFWRQWKAGNKGDPGDWR
jgi:hypothetical protein